MSKSAKFTIDDGVELSRTMENAATIRVRQLLDKLHFGKFLSVYGLAKISGYSPQHLQGRLMGIGDEYRIKDPNKANRYLYGSPKTIKGWQQGEANGKD